MNFLRRSFSSNDINKKDFNVIEQLLDQTRPKLKTSKTTNFQKDNIHLTGDKYNNNSDRSNEPVDYYPNLDASVWMRSCEEEVITPINGTVFGHVPDWLKGSLLRNGPGSLKVGEYRFNHLFDSSALLHRFEIKNGKVTYQSRFVQTDVFKKNHAAKRIVVTEFGTKSMPDPCQSIYNRVAAVFRPASSDNSMISVYPFGDEYYTFTESPIIHRIDPQSLETLDKVNVADYVNIVSHTSHPHVMSDGTIFNLGMSITKKGPAYSIVEFSPSAFTQENNSKKRKLSIFDQAKIVSTIPARWILNPSYMHTFGITENYFIIVEQPLALAIPTLLSNRLTNEPMCSSFKWYEKENTHIHLVDRHSGNLVKTFIAEKFFYLHIINQYETRDGNYVVLDICCYRDPKMLDCMYIDVMKNLHQNPDYSRLFRGRPLRFIMPLKTPEPDTPSDRNLIKAYDIYCNSDESKDKNSSKKQKKIEKNHANNKRGQLSHPLQKKAQAFRLPNGNIFVEPELLCDLGCETPRINSEICLGKEYRYFYAMSSDVDIDYPGTIIKVDLQNKTKKVWYEKDIYPSEPVFVADPNGTTEDDGIVLSALVWGRERETEVGLLILDAKTFKELARVTFQTPSPVPKCLHGWFSDVVS